MYMYIYMNNKEQIINLRDSGGGRNWREEKEDGDDEYSTCVPNSQKLKT